MTANLPTTKLGAILAAAKKLPAHTGAAAQGAARHEARQLAILADVSGSMEERAGARRRIDILREAVDLVFGDVSATLIAFASLPRVVDRHQLPEPSGGTAMHLAIRHGATLGLRRLLVISDGGPDSASQALDAAAAFGGPIDVIYCGDDSDVHAKRFMEDLARRTGGRVVRETYAAGAPAIASAVKRLALTGPGP